MVYTLVYQPISNLTQIKTISATPTMIRGVAVAAHQIDSRFKILDLDPSFSIPSKDTTLPYHGKINQVSVYFNNPDFIDGAILVCVLMGLPWDVIITDLKYMGFPWTPSYDFYIGQILIDPIEDYHQVPIDWLQHYISSPSVASITESLDQCFHLGSDISMFVPSVVHFGASDTEFQQINIVSMATPYLLHLPSQYHNLNAYYIYNVCASEEYRGRGLTKSILITQINYLISINITHFLLEVDPSNVPAVHLYQNLGFKKIDQNENFDLYYFSV